MSFAESMSAYQLLVGPRFDDDLMSRGWAEAASDHGQLVVFRQVELTKYIAAKERRAVWLDRQNVKRRLLQVVEAGRNIIEDPVMEQLAAAERCAQEKKRTEDAFERGRQAGIKQMRTAMAKAVVGDSNRLMEEKPDGAADAS